MKNEFFFLIKEMYDPAKSWYPLIANHPVGLQHQATIRGYTLF